MKISQLPERSQIETLMRGPADTPVVMVNLLSFKPHADGASEGSTGEEAYRRYGDKMSAFVASKGGRILWTGRVDSMVIGESDAELHMIALVEYPDRRTFLEIASDPYVAEIGVPRREGLAGQWLIAATTIDPPGTS